MKKLILNITAMLLCLQVMAQNIPNPYASIGKPAPKMATVTQGAYNEFITQDSLVLINGDAISRATGELVYSKESHPKIIAALTQNQDDRFRFLSIDPLAKRFPFYTPYQFAGNSPIAAIDLDGLESFVATKNPYSNAIILTLLNAEDVLSVTWSEKDKETKTDPLQITEVQKFVYNVKVDKQNGTITVPESNSNKEQTSSYTKYEKNDDGTFKKDANGQLIPNRGQGILESKEINTHISGNFGIEIPGGLQMGQGFSDDEVINRIWSGATLKNDDYDQIDVFIKPEQRGQFFEIAKKMDLDINKINFVEKPQKGDNNKFEMIYKKTDKAVDEIE